MNELGTRIRGLRGALSLEEFARKHGVALRTVANVEDGVPIRKETLLRIARRAKLTKDETDSLMVAWIRSKLGPDADGFWIEPKRETSNLTDCEDSKNCDSKLIDKIRSLPVRHQQEILKASDRPEVLASLKHLNSLYDRLKR